MGGVEGEGEALVGGDGGGVRGEGQVEVVMEIGEARCAVGGEGSGDAGVWCLRWCLYGEGQDACGEKKPNEDRSGE